MTPEDEPLCQRRLCHQCHHVVRRSGTHGYQCTALVCTVAHPMIGCVPERHPVRECTPRASGRCACTPDARQQAAVV